jgi:hypothetical protein
MKSLQIELLKIIKSLSLKKFYNLYNDVILMIKRIMFLYRLEIHTDAKFQEIFFKSFSYQN